jgi:predicted membrane channel-forming protein YqfA (hemolysin III family)
MTDALGQLAGTLLFMFVVMLVVGGVYYLIRRPRIAFWGAVFRWVVLIAVLLVVINILGRLSTA